MSIPKNITFSSVQKYQAYLEKNGPSAELTANTAVLVEGLERTAEDDGAGWSTVGIGHSISHGGKYIFEKAGLNWDSFNSSGKMSESQAKQLFINGDYKRFEAIAHKHLGKEWFESQPRNFQDAVVLEVFNKGDKGFFNIAKETQGYTDTVDTAKIAKLKSNDPKQIFEAFTTGQSVSASRKVLKGGNGDTVRERLASRRPWAGALAIAHLTETPGVVPIEYLDAMTQDPLLASMSREEIISRSVKYSNSRGSLKLEGVDIPDFVQAPETRYAYNGDSKKTKEYTPTQNEHVNSRRKKDFVYDIADLPDDVQSGLMAFFALVLFALGEHEMAEELLQKLAGGSTHSTDEFRESYDTTPKTDGFSYDGKGSIHGSSKKYSGKLPGIASGEDSGQYFARAAETFIGKKEVGENRGNFVDWVMERAGLDGTGNPWCAGFVSKIYEGSGLYNYSASSLNIMSQAGATGSFRSGTHKVNGIEVGDTIVFDRGTKTDYKGHIGIVTGVTHNSAGKVTHVETVEGNKGDKVSNINYSISELKSARYLGYGDISHRAEKLGIDLEAKLRGGSKEVMVAKKETEANPVAEKAAEGKKPNVKAPSEKAPVSASALDEAQKLTAGLELKDSAVLDNGWPPGVDSSVLEQALANKMNGLA